MLCRNRRRDGRDRRVPARRRGGGREQADARRARLPGHGYGAAILSSLEEAALRDSYERVVLWTHELLAAARAVYESLGYNETGREAGRDGHDRIRYAKRL